MYFSNVKLIVLTLNNLKADTRTNGNLNCPVNSKNILRTF